MTYKDTAINLARKAGYSVVPLWREKNLAIATLLKRIIDHHSIDAVIDVGANAGQYREFLRKEVSFTGNIYSFEPQPELANVLERAKANDSRWRIFPFALGEAKSELLLNVMERSQFSSFLEPDNSATPQFAELNKVKRQCMVPVERLDEITLPVENRFFLKVDTQGFDMQVIRGATGMLDRIAAIQLEVSVRNIYKGAPGYRDVLRELEEFGFLPAGFFPVSELSSLAAVEFDCVLVRE